MVPLFGGFCSKYRHQVTCHLQQMRYRSSFAIAMQGIENCKREKALYDGILVATLQCSAVILIICCDHAGHTELQA